MQAKIKEMIDRVFYGELAEDVIDEAELRVTGVTGDRDVEVRHSDGHFW